MIDWDAIRAWDEEYYAHVFVTADEYEHVPIARADGDFVELADGTRLLDFTSGLLCTNAGHRNERIRDAIVEALDRYGFVWEGYATDYRSRAAKLIVDDLLGEDDWAGRVRFCSSGSEAIEMALLVAKLVTGRPNVISRDFAYHGWTHGALSLMGLPGARGILASAETDEIRRPAGIPMPGVHFGPAPYCFDCPIGHTYPACKRGGETLACIDALEHLILTLGPDSIAAVVAEPIFGVGMFHPPAEYLPQLRALTRRHGILWIDDEVMTGFGRTGRNFAYQHSPGVTPDLMALGKGMVSAALPAGRPRAQPRDRRAHGRVSLGDGEHLRRPPRRRRGRLRQPRVAARGARRRARGRARRAHGPAAARARGDPSLRCRGRRRGSPLGGRARAAGRLRRALRPADRHALPAGPPQFSPSFFLAGECAKRGVALATAPPNTLRLGPPLTTTEAHIDLGVGVLREALDELAEVGAPSAAARA